MKRFKLVEKLKTNFAFLMAQVEDYEDDDSLDKTMPESERSEILRGAVVLVEGFLKRFGKGPILFAHVIQMDSVLAQNSMWKVLQQKIGLPPTNTPKALSFWMASSLPVMMNEKEKYKLLKTRSLYRRYETPSQLTLCIYLQQSSFLTWKKTD